MFSMSIIRFVNKAVAKLPNHVQFTLTGPEYIYSGLSVR